jgi:uncharacterized protein YeeX (DUF496 family)
MKKIIISNKQLMEDISLAQTGKTSNIVNAVSDAAKSVLKNNLPMPVKNPNGGEKGKVLNLTIDKSNGLKPSDANIIQNQNPEAVNVVSPTDTSTTNTLMEKTYSKKHIEEVRKFNGRVMTKRELMESWLSYDERPNTIEGIIEKLREETVNAESRLNDYISTLNEISNELQKAVEEIKEELQRNGVNITGTEVNYYGDGFDIKIKTNWVLKGDGFYDDPEDEALYRALSHVTGAPYQIDYGRPYRSDYHYVHFGIEEGDGDDCNPYFEINCNIPDLNNNEEDY